ncbi:MAG: Sulfate transport system permease protein CysW [Candidatus Izimaplasma bacterium HR2]|nr:MAG: Sulfate transport system permease protein CysW [Candidatus Izimaplasma bacterium HR2]
MILESIIEAFKLLISFDPEIYSIIFLSLAISILATLTAAVIGTFLGILISISDFKLKRFTKKIVFTLMGIPPVVLGLVVLLLITGPFDGMNLLFTKSAMYIAQTLLVLPIIIGNIIITSEKTQKQILETATTLGASKIDKIFLLIIETKPFIFMSIILGFSRALSEVGAVMLVGGNIKGDTRVMTTYIALNNSMGEYSMSIAMGFILLSIAFLLHTLLARFRGDFYD